MSGERCLTLRERFSEYLDGELEGSARAEILAHLKTCAGCRDEMEEVRATIETVRVHGRVAAPQGLAEAVRGRLHRPRLRPWPALTLASTILVGLGLGFLALREGSHRPTAGEQAIEEKDDTVGSTRAIQQRQDEIGEEERSSRPSATTPDVSDVLVARLEALGYRTMNAAPSPTEDSSPTAESSADFLIGARTRAAADEKRAGGKMGLPTKEEVAAMQDEPSEKLRPLDSVAAAEKAQRDGERLKDDARRRALAGVAESKPKPAPAEPALGEAVREHAEATRATRDGAAHPASELDARTGLLGKNPSSAPLAGAATRELNDQALGYLGAGAELVPLYVLVDGRDPKDREALERTLLRLGRIAGQTELERKVSVLDEKKRGAKDSESEASTRDASGSTGGRVVAYELFSATPATEVATELERSFEAVRIEDLARVSELFRENETLGLRYEFAKNADPGEARPEASGTSEAQAKGAPAAAPATASAARPSGEGLRGRLQYAEDSDGSSLRAPPPADKSAISARRVIVLFRYSLASSKQR